LSSFYVILGKCRCIIGKWVRMENLCVLGECVQVEDGVYMNGGKVLPHISVDISVTGPKVIM